MTTAPVPHLADRLQRFGTTIFTEMTQLAQAHDAVNLGQGFPDFDGPDFVKEAAIQAIRDGHNQYARSPGLPALCDAVAEHQARFWGAGYDPASEITVTSGATEAIASTLLALCQPGDEVVLFEPYYDSYRACVAMAGATCRFVTLQSPDFHYDPAALEAAITPQTRAILLNTPHNPTGKVYTREELEHLAAVAKRHDLLVITDEVYEHLVFEGEHIALSTLDGMREGTVRISSTGKTFSLTGWKIGFTMTTPELSRAIRTVHQFVTFCTSTPFQVAMVEALRAPDDYYDTFLADYRTRRDLLCDGLADLGFDVLRPAGTYFATTDIRSLGHDDDRAFCRMLPEAAGVAAIPCSVFCETPEAGRHLVRWAFCKSTAVIEQGLERLAAWRRSR